MKNILLIVLSLLWLLQATANEKPATSISGQVQNLGNQLPFVSISIKATNIGTITDETGHFKLSNLPEGVVTVRAQAIGFKPAEKTIYAEPGQNLELDFELDEDVLELEGIVITGNRNETNRQQSATLVNSLSSRFLNSAQMATLSEGLEFCSGLRMENNCQNCGFTQVRMNGLEGPYSQILINSRPVYGGLAGVYGLELFPANMIERIEVTRGGGSALYGGNAIAGTINLILRDPISNTYELGIGSGFSGIGKDIEGNPASDHIIRLNTSLTSSDFRTGLALYGFYRSKDPFDANNDGFSEISKIENVTIGSRFFYRFGTKSKISADFFSINESRRGGNKFDYLPHESDITEAVTHKLNTLALTWEKHTRQSDLWSVYASGQLVKRDSYYGAMQSLSDYGYTEEVSYVFGSHYMLNFESSNLLSGIEYVGSNLNDSKLGFPDIENALIDENGNIIIPHTSNVTVANQAIHTTGVFSQYEMQWNKLLLSIGARFDHYQIEDKEQSASLNTGNVFSPRINIKYDIFRFAQARVSYSTGYRAPQIFDEDLHIETSGSRQVIHENSPELVQENSNSIMGSLDFNKRFGNVRAGLLIEGFYTRLQNPFANEYGEPDENGVVIYTRVNAEDGAVVKGVNLELNLSPTAKMNMKAGFTLQSSMYEEPQEFDERRFFRTPGDYGFFTWEWAPWNNWAFTTTGVYTGKMLIPYFGPEAADPEEGELRQSPNFFDIGINVRYNIKISGATMQLYAGMKNIFNSYQNDFDTGIDRDPGYMYGPMSPRTVFFGIRIGNFLR